MEGKNSGVLLESKVDVDYLGIFEHRIEVDELCRRYSTDPEKGLFKISVQEHRLKYGKNEITQAPPGSLFYQYTRHTLQGISSLMVAGAIVCIIALVTELIGNEDSSVDKENLFIGSALLFFMGVSGIFSYIRERTAAKVLNKSKSIVKFYTRVIRDGVKSMVPNRDLVVGDLVELKSGDEIPADIRVIRSFGYTVDTAPMTGHTEPRVVTVDPSHSHPSLTQNILFASTYRMCHGIVIRVGNKSLVGRIARITSSLKTKETTLSHNISTILILFTSVGFFFAMICWIGALRLDFSWPQATVFFVGICIAFVPESLLAAITVCHTVAGKRMIKRGCIAKNFESIENLGSTSVLCVDKTGTLTQNKMDVCNVWTGKIIHVVDNKFQESVNKNGYVGIAKLLRCIIITSNSSLITVEKDGISQIKAKGRDPADVAVLNFAAATHNKAIILRKEFPKLLELPFNYETLYQLSVHPDPKSVNKCRIGIRGAPERVFALCSSILIGGIEEKISDSTRLMLEDALSSMGKNMERVFGFCDQIVPHPPNWKSVEELKKNCPVTGYRFLGLVALSDTPRIGTMEFVKKLQTASIKVTMLTGDHDVTALAIAKAVGIIPQGMKTANEIAKEAGIPIEEVTKEMSTAAVFTDKDVREMSETGKLAEVLQKFDAIVFARVSPDIKASIVELYQKNNEVVTMVGDGVNDCAALRAANTSIALGSGTSAAKEISDIVLLGNDFESISTGIEEGRLVFENMIKCFAFTITLNIPQVLPFMLFLILGIPLPINPLSIIVLTVGIDMFPAVALAYEHAEWDLMTDSVSDSLKQHKILTYRIIERAYLRIGIVQFVAGMFSYAYAMSENGFNITDLFFVSSKWYSPRIMADSYGQEWTYDQRSHLEDTAQTAYFFAIALTQLVHVFGCKTRRQSIFTHGIRNWRLNLSLLVPISLTILVITTQFLHIAHTSRIEAIGWRLLIPPVPFAIYIFVYDELRRLLIRKYPNSLFTYLYY